MKRLVDKNLKIPFAHICHSKIISHHIHHIYSFLEDDLCNKHIHSCIDTEQIKSKNYEIRCLKCEDQMILEEYGKHNCKRNCEYKCGKKLIES